MIFIFLFIMFGDHVFGKTDFTALHAGLARVEFSSTGQSQTFTGEHYPLLGAPGENAYSYYGIRYGTAKRFEYSVINTDFSYLNLSNRPKQGFVCPKAKSESPGASGQKEMNEDCLYLDVYVPPVSKNQIALFPVLFFIHGGGFVRGDKDSYNATFLAADIRSVVITMNYRLYVLGFLSTKDDTAKGNWGIGDVKLALRWTQEHVESFGGDPDKITISGVSTGGVLTSILMLDDSIRAEVQAAIAMSGSVMSPYVDQDIKAISSASAEAEKHGCLTNNLTQMVECLRQIPFERFYESSEVSSSIPCFEVWLEKKRGSCRDFLATAFNTESHICSGKVAGVCDVTITVTTDCYMKGPLNPTPSVARGDWVEEVKFGPVTDGIHIKGHPTLTVPHSVQSEKREATYTIGYTKDEGSYLGVYDLETFNFSRFQSEVACYLPHIKLCPNEGQAILDQITSYYAVPREDDPKKLLSHLQRIFTDLWLVYPSTKESLLYASRSFSNQVPNYQYLISYATKVGEMGAFHGIDVGLLFRGTTGLVPYESLSWQAQVSMKNMFRQITSTGKSEGKPFGSNADLLEMNKHGEWEGTQKELTKFMGLWNSVYKFRCPGTNDTNNSDPNNALPTGSSSVWTFSILITFFGFLL